MKKLLKYMKKNKLDHARLAVRLGVCQATLYNWTSSRRKPCVTFAIKLEKLTRGAVSVYDWK